MDFVGVEEIQPYENLYRYKIFKYDDIIEIGKNENYICDLKFIKLDINPIYKGKEIEESIGYAIVENINKNIDISLNKIEEKIKKFIIREIPLINLDERSINVIFSLNK
ncbi:hypothetical protein [Tepidibacter thalassicus]|uniref:Uncharacterized protein n=1 Tax=Tepidibacter thalassicus DSM 15285 TaxID=1123350 RepID=A0A1M5PNG7_9FIRM|nr:hypothetical protein [Tepidibacter thalassicus]SHH03271.1 hypothetical protein SAMN02744040_00599 [Tepidibacter thalassicus DSM 15285]